VVYTRQRGKRATRPLDPGEDIEVGQRLVDVVRILIAGLPAELKDSLKQRLEATEGLAIQVAQNGEETLFELLRGDCKVLILDHHLAGLSAPNLLVQARRELGLDKVRVFYCIERDELGRLPATLSKNLSVGDQMLLHPLDPEKLAYEIAESCGTRLSHQRDQLPSPEDEITEAASGLWEQFKGRIFEQLETLEGVSVALLEGALDSESRQKAEREAHKLAGSLGSLGLLEGTRLARELEQMLRAGEPLREAECPRLCDGVVALRKVLERGPAAHAPPSPSGATEHEMEAKRKWESQQEHSTPLLLVVDPDTELAGDIATEAAHLGLQAEMVSSLVSARSFISRRKPAAVLLDPCFAGEPDGGLALLSELGAGQPPVPALVYSASGSFSHRLEAARRGVRVFLEKPLAPSQVVDAVMRVLAQTTADAVRVLAVDNDLAILASLRFLLEPQNMTITTVSEPMKFWDTLVSVSPHVLLLGFEMQQPSGIDLCRVLRNDSRWNGIPVLFLATQADAETAERIFIAGGDDCVSKSSLGPELVTRVTARIVRARWLAGSLENPVATGIAGFHKSVRVFDQLLRMAHRYQQPLCLAVLQVDTFDQIQQLYGPQAGDQVYRRVGQLLLGAFRCEDVVTRWAGDEFALGLYGARRADGVQRLAELLESLRQEEFRGNAEARFHVTFSAGVAQYPNDGLELQSLYKAAAETLQQARAMGGDRVLQAGWRPQRQENSSQLDVVLVDDDPTLAGLLLHALQTRGYRAEWLKDGQTAVQMLAGPNPSLQPRLLLLDVDLPSVDGLSVLRRLAKTNVHGRMRIIMLTARSSESEVIKALEWGAFDHVAKPFSLPVLMQRIRRALEP